MMVFAQHDFDRLYVWDRAPAIWANTPTLVIAERDSLYPSVPDVKVLLSCKADRSLTVWGKVYEFGTDLGGPPRLMPMFGLRSRDVSLLAEPIWEYGGFSKSAHYVLHPSQAELNQLLRGPWFEVSEVYADGDGATRYPPPPRELADTFIRQCQTAAEIKQID
ncbi:hypothetical protein [Brevundimonas sp. SGAir0440]|uniref:hypothetical protein n=3 Tax=Brevundimonas TaxID=41275 RepID=UPI0010F6107B|nr:hypothetical protein [Brevundimonas sp. SGAir0440]